MVFNADEALAAGAKDVVFAQPIPLYVENFLNFPVGTGIPLGAYNHFLGKLLKPLRKHIKILGPELMSLNFNGSKY